MLDDELFAVPGRLVTGEKGPESDVDSCSVSWLPAFNNQLQLRLDW